VGMSAFATLILAVQMLSALAMIGLILIQHGKGADMGAAFGGGSSGSLFGATGSANFLSRTTAALAVVFFLTSLGLAYMATHKTKVGGSVIQGATSQPETAAAPATEVPKPATAPAKPKANEAPK